MTSLTHLDDDGRARMVDVGAKPVTRRVAIAEGRLDTTAEVVALVRSDGLSGDEAFLVVRYEYTPGFDDLDAVATGGQGHYWVNDHLKLGLTASSSSEANSTPSR